MSYYLGLDVGSVNAKAALIDDNSDIAWLDTQRVTTGPRDAASTLISRLAQRFDLDQIASASMSGLSNGIIPADLGWSNYSSALAISSAILHSHPDAKTIVQIGGQRSLVVSLENGLRKPWRVASNPLCAAGTGRFLEQQAYRLDIDLEDFSRLALEGDGDVPRIAARCSVFAKTDLIHMQQKGVPVNAMLRSLCDSVARMITSFKKGVFEEPIYVVGGVAGSAAVLVSLDQAISDRNNHETHVILPQDHLHCEALGAALLAKESGKRSRVVLLEAQDEKEQYLVMPRLEKVFQHDGWKRPETTQAFTGYLGVDVGSTSTKAVIVDESGRIVMRKHYLMTAGRPLEAVKQVFQNLVEQGAAEQATIAGVGVTGSGRYLIGSFIGADLIKNEITAQTRAGEEEDPEADIIEIGGQDSKLVIKRHGVVVDYQMNKSCAAGTGSFIDELAEMLGVSVKDGQFARLAFDAPHTIDLGSRCAAFMGQAVTLAQQQGVPLGIITASLSNSIAANYLSKVVEHRKLGDKVILTGAVFYNDAVVSAFKQALGDKTIIVPEHKEVTGAIGAALLAKEYMRGAKSTFKGFREVVDAEYTLKTFVCQRCDNNCTISRLEVPGEGPTFYGSRCDFYDATIRQEKQQTSLDEREALLFKDYKEGSGEGPTVGLPRALLIYDWAPLFLTFLNELGAKVVLSSKTNKQIMEDSVELSYTDSCFPMKLLYGHAASLKDVDFVLSPSFLRLGRKEGEENQKYACPLVQASPFLIREALDLDSNILIPFVDLSTGDDNLINSLVDAAKKMGFSKREGRKAAKAGLVAQREFDRTREECGKRLLQQIRDEGKIGVVLFARAYMFQDSGANLGIAEKLAQLDVVPIPLDYLPLSSIDVKQYSDRPYWMYESKHIAGAVITASDPNLYGMVLTNFGCGPNSFILNLVDDIMGSKPLGQLEIDEHAAEAGIVTRLEAFVDTIKAFSVSGKAQNVPVPAKEIRRAVVGKGKPHARVIIPKMAAGADVVAAAMQACGVDAHVLPPADQTNLVYSNRVTTGKECLPYRVVLGDFMKFFYENKDNGISLDSVEGFMPTAYGPCRYGKYAPEQAISLKEIGFDLPLRGLLSNDAYRDENLGTKFERSAWKGIVAVDTLEKLLWHNRPYEKVKGSADKLFEYFLKELADRIRSNKPYDDLLKRAPREFEDLIDHTRPRRPLVGINGEIFLRSNSFSNDNLVKVCEDAGLEVIVSPFGEWIKYVTHRNIEDGMRDRKIGRILKGYLRRAILNRDEKSVITKFGAPIGVEEPSIGQILSLSEEYLSPKCGSEAVLSIGSGIEWLHDPAFAGVISVMPHGCMPGGIVAAMADSLSAQYSKPWISVTYDGFMETNNLTKINNFAEILCATATTTAR